MTKTYDYIIEHGISTDNSYPYTETGDICRNGTASGVRVSGYVALNKTEETLKQAVGKLFNKFFNVP